MTPPLPHRLLTSLQSLITSGADFFGAGIQQIVHEGEQDQLLLKQLERCPIRYSLASLDEEHPELAHLIHTTLVMRKRAFQAINGYRSEWKTSADCDLVCRSHYAGLKWAVANEIVSLRLLHSASITHTVPTSKSKGNKEEIRQSAALMRQKKRRPAEFGRLQQDQDPSNLVQTRVKQQRIHMTYDGEGWAYYHRCQSLAQRAPTRYRISCSDAPATEKVDLTLTNNYTRVPTELEALRRHSDKVIVSHNADDRRCLSVLRHNLLVADMVIGKSPTLTSHHAGHGRLEIVPTGYEPRLFHPRDDLLSRAPKVLWISSSSKVELKGKRLMDSARPQLEALGFQVDMKVIDPQGKGVLPPQKMADWYHSGTVFVSCSSSEDGPNTLIEAAACGLGIVSTRVGYALELIQDGKNGVLIDPQVEDLVAGVVKAQSLLSAFARNMRSVLQEWSWDHRAGRFYDLFDQLLLKDVVLTSYYTKIKDPQRHQFHPGDSNERMRLARSCQKQGLDCIVFHDGLSPRFQDQYPGVQFIYDRVVNPYSCNDHRFFAYRDWLQHHPYRYVWMSDLFDSEIRLNPATMARPGLLTVGRETVQWRRNDAMIARCQKLYRDFDLNRYIMYAGTWGGDCKVVQRVLHALCDEMKNLNAFNTNLTAFNEVVYRDFPEEFVSFAYPFVSGFRKNEDRDDVCFIHK